jgi:hypothetical protein
MISVKKSHDLIVKYAWNWWACRMIFHDVKDKGIVWFKLMIDLVRSSFHGRRSAFVSDRELALNKVKTSINIDLFPTPIASIHKLWYLMMDPVEPAVDCWALWQYTRRALPSRTRVAPIGPRL